MVEQIAELKALLDKATPGPWRLCHHLESLEKDASCPCGYRGGIWGPDGEHLVLEMGSTPEAEGHGPATPRYPRNIELANAAFIVKSVELAPALIARIEELERQLQGRGPWKTSDIKGGKDNG